MTKAINGEEFSDKNSIGYNGMIELATEMANKNIEVKIR